MRDGDFDSHEHVIDDDFNLESPSQRSFGSPGPQPAVHTQPQTNQSNLPLLRLSDWDPDHPYDERPPTCVHYSIEWKLLLNKGTVTSKIARDTEKDVVLAPQPFWERTLRAKVEDLLKRKTPRNKVYAPEETNVTVSVTKPSERDYSRRFELFDVGWDSITKQLEDWSHLHRSGKKLRIDVSFVCVEETQPSMITRSIARRGATGAQLTEREGIMELQQNTGQPSVWSAVYSLMRCPGHPCKNQASYCFRDPDTKKHWPLDSSDLTKLVRYAEEGSDLKTHKDVPEAIRELIYAKEQQKLERKHKRKATADPEDSHPIKIINVLPSCDRRHEATAGADGADGEPGSVASAGRAADFFIPEPRDKAIQTYCQWHCNRIIGAEWKKGFQKAFAVAMKECLDLKHIYEDQDVDFFVQNGVSRGIARSFVGDIKAWASEVDIS
ncbi:uncharacterized protein F5Z01DRAFT_669079 [Emericellopsis atlantica]|uniref:Uncharacterized protein n=1 Tax=Emericellopsis atlantica TaxID=2614577 RepID=A0A9P8CK30_9HYPO|nr:uncharacterized protein F5Z01DRAFT_669079 [Emericellopsis atlantica]KAG9249510.1 hypothetical protein F5Z01DRAFT_669079 [Emericellopsis atlantica]